MTQPKVDKPKTNKQGIDWSKKDMYDGIGRPDLKPKQKKDCMFQYATKYQTFVDTGLITRKRADKLLEDNLQHLKEHWDEFNSPQMGIWINCDSNTSYHTLGIEIDYRDCKLKDGHFYRIKEELVL